MPVFPFDPEQLVAASFRGVPFYVDGMGGTAGRRAEQHEYPNRDLPYAEDLGRAAREYTFDGYVIGRFFGLQRDALLTALEAYGPGLLDHPFLGQIEVVARPCTYKQGRDDGGWCRFTLNFIEAGRNAFPDDEPDTAAEVETDAAAGRAVFAGIVDALQSTRSASDEAARASLDTVGAIGGQIGDAFAPVEGLSGGSAGDLIDGTVNAMVDGATDALESRSLGAAIVGAIRDIADLAAGIALERDVIAGSIDRRTGTPSAVQRQGAIEGLFALSEAVRDDGAVYPRGSDATPTRLLVASDRARIAALVRRSALLEAARLSARLDFDAADDAADLRGRFSDAFDREIDAASDDRPPGADDAGARMLLRLRATVMRDLSARAADKAPLMAYSMATARPALAQAWALYPGDDAIADRADQLVRRNRCIHPAFLPREGEAIAA